MMKLTQDEDAVLRFLYENRDEEHISSERISAGTGLPNRAVKRALRHLHECGYVCGTEPLLDRCVSMLRKLDPNFLPTHENFADHIVLIASALIGASDEELAEELDYDVDFVKTVGSRLRSSGVWVGDKLAEGCLNRWSENALSFFMDGAVASGFWIISDNSDPSNPIFQMTDSGLAKAAALIKKLGNSHD